MGIIAMWEVEKIENGLLELLSCFLEDGTEILERLRGKAPPVIQSPAVLRYRARITTLPSCTVSLI